ncbi:ATP-binding protein involved in chromosome partitioning [Marinobacter daqiaonensis]|uniref:Iron-sulfur cluster carrier protein n=1 Tax=Marinobacter daqiaonensis TaxID=650891 RepID=A0A1I6GFX8_9GAMM|nr:iron-sulfur cluster carrier protein ApbC [Marinobacter daqiaonensis]SFR41079.1 ATP-binding protein involved in chromosome partitioning [Marinobacter daqiaonensis]
MAEISRSALEGAVREYRDPYLATDLYQLDAVKALDADDQGRVTLTVELPYASQGIAGGMAEILTNALEGVEGVASAEVRVGQRIHAHKAQRDLESIGGIKNIIAIASGKGGVGKSTTAVNLALALSAEGARVGILDADIYGPSVGMMLGIPEGQRPGTEGDKYFLPIQAHGIQAMSMAFLVTDKTPMVWRGPMVSGAVQQLLTQTLWKELDYLVVDMPPGTGDIQLTLAQKVPVTGAVVVTTPQDIALLDCKKGIEMFRKVEIPVLGVVENMSIHICSNCGHEEPLFGQGGGQRVADDYQTELLGQLPLHLTIREQTDGGNPSVVAEPDSEVARRYRDIARRLSAGLSTRAKNQSGPIPSISISDD